MLIRIVLGFASLLALFVAVVALRPSAYRVSRSAIIAAPPGAAYTLVSDFRQWQSWSPWEKLDPEMKRTFEGPAAGTGAIYKWSGNNKAGEGRMAITDSIVNELVRIKLDFIKPFASSSVTEFTFKPEANGVRVNWDMQGENNLIAKAFTMFMNLDTMIGGDFEKGLAQMKAVAEKAQR